MPFRLSGDHYPVNLGIFFFEDTYNELCLLHVHCLQLLSTICYNDSDNKTLPLTTQLITAITRILLLLLLIMMVVMDDGDEDVNKDDDDVGDSYNTTNISLN